MSEPTPLEHARAVKLRLRAADKVARDARKEWTDLRAMSDVEWGVRRVHDATVEMWNTERDLASIAEEWRACLAARAAMPKAERWNLAGVERWAEIAAVMERQP